MNGEASLFSVCPSYGSGWTLPSFRLCIFDPCLGTEESLGCPVNAGEGDFDSEFLEVVS